jgi:hypothetical protein
VTEVMLARPILMSILATVEIDDADNKRLRRMINVRFVSVRRLSIDVVESFRACAHATSPKPWTRAQSQLPRSWWVGTVNGAATDCNQGLQRDTVSFTRFLGGERLTLPQGMVGQDYAWAVSLAASGASID